MKKELISPEYITHDDNTSPMSVFVPERFQLRIGLRRGSEIITLGTATIIVTGEESDDIRVSVPITSKKSEVEDVSGKRRRSKLFGKSSSKKKKLKPASFTKDHRKYSLDDSSCLNVLIRATPAKNENSPDAMLSYGGIPKSIQISSKTDVQLNELRQRSRSRSHSNPDNQYVNVKNTRSLSRSKGIMKMQNNHSMSHVPKQSIYQVIEKYYEPSSEPAQVSASDSASGESSSNPYFSGKRSKSFDTADIETNQWRNDENQDFGGITTSRNKESKLKKRNRSRSHSNVDFHFSKHLSKHDSTGSINHQFNKKLVSIERSLFGSSSIFSCSNMMNVLDNGQGKVYNSKETMHIDPSSDDESSKNDMCIGSIGDAHTPGSHSYPSTPNSASCARNKSLLCDSDDDTVPQDEYTCATQPTRNFPEDRARSMIHNYANRVGVHPAKMI